MCIRDRREGNSEAQTVRERERKKLKRRNGTGTGEYRDMKGKPWTHVLGLVAAKSFPIFTNNNIQHGMVLMKKCVPNAYQ